MERLNTMENRRIRYSHAVACCLLLCAACLGPLPMMELQDETPPVIVSVSPADGATNQAVSTPITVIYDEDIRSSSLQTDTIVLSNQAASNLVPLSISLASYASNVVVATPSNYLTSGTRYTIFIKAGVKNRAGLAGEQALQTSFTTYGVE